MTGEDTKEVVDRFQVNVKKDTLLMFQEDSDTPVASLAMDDLPTNTILEVMEKHQYLQLPRLSNQKVIIPDLALVGSLVFTHCTGLL